MSIETEILAGNLQEPDYEARYNFKFEGQIELVYEDFKVFLDRALWRIFFQGGQVGPTTILLDVRFMPKSAKKLARYFPLLQGAENNLYSYTFGLHPLLLEKHAQDFANLSALDDDWLFFKEGLLLKLENYRCLGHGSFDTTRTDA